ncbi:hypothetical protein ACOMHN_017038 [Nucella lapillus]
MAECKGWLKKLTRRKVCSDQDLERSELRRCLKTWELIGLGIGNTLGAGVYVLSGQVARESAGPAVLLAFLVAGLCASLAGLCYAEFAARVPKAGSAYVYSYVIVGELMAFVIGWNILLEYITCVGANARAISAYVDDLTGRSMQSQFLNYMPLSVPGLAPYPDFFALALVVLATMTAAAGVKESARVKNVLAGITLLVVIAVIILGSFKADFRNWQLSGDQIPKPNQLCVVSFQLPAHGAGNGGFTPFGFSGVMASSATCFYAFVGFDFIASMSEEAEDSRRPIPISMGVTLLVNMAAYCGVAAVLTLMVPYFALDPGAPVAFAFEQVGWGPARYIITLGALAGMAGSDGLIFRSLSAVSPRFRTPVLGTVLSGLAAGVMALLFDVRQVVDMLSIGTLLAFGLVAVCVLILSRQPPNPLHVRFKVPLVPVLPAISFQVNVYLIFKLTAVTGIRFAVWLVIGFCIYFFYGIRHSSLNTAPEERKTLIVTDGKELGTQLHQCQSAPCAPCCYNTACRCLFPIASATQTIKHTQMQDPPGESLQ